MCVWASVTVTPRPICPSTLSADDRPALPARPGSIASEGLLRRERKRHRSALAHLAATETYYGMNTFENKKWDSWSDDLKKKWDPAMNLGEAGRKTIKGHDLDYYLNTLRETREHSLAEFRKRDDSGSYPPIQSNSPAATR